MSLLLAPVVFLAAIALDLVAARYSLAVRDEHWHAAARASVAMCLLSTLGILAVVTSDRWLLAPECAGLYAGTLLAGRISRRHKT